MGIVILIAIFIGLVWLIQKTAKGGLKAMEKAEARQKAKRLAEANPYINMHQAHLDNDTYYNQYLKWCGDTGNIPMKKQVFINDIHNKEKYLQDLFDSL